MQEGILLSLAAIVVLGIGAQWLAWRLKLPSILLLLLAGLLAGPVTGVLDPDAIFGPLLLPIVSLSVALILFEGGLSLKLRELESSGRVIGRLVTVGALVTWVISAGAARLLLGMQWPEAVLLGAVLVVSGPTVVIPLLRHVRPAGSLGAILKWEGIVIDPIGAMLAVLVFEAILHGPQAGVGDIAVGVLKTTAAGVGVGLLGGGLLFLVLHRYWVPRGLLAATAVLLVVASYVLANHLQPESGLFAATVMGLVLANQRSVQVRPIIRFGEDINVLLLSALFILLAARLRIDDLRALSWGSAAFVLVLILVARPLAVLASTVGSDLGWRQRAFLAWVAPRGIVAAAVSALFALRLSAAGRADAQSLVAETFLVIVATVLVYGLTARPVARWLRVTHPPGQGVLFVGAHPLARAIAQALQQEGVRVLLVDTNWQHVAAARLDGLPTVYASAVSEYVQSEVDLGWISAVLAVTSNDELNSLVAVQFGEILDQRVIFQLPPAAAHAANPRREALSRELQARQLFNQELTYEQLAERFRRGATVKKTPLTETFDFDTFLQHHGDNAVPLFVVTEAGKLVPFACDNPPAPKAGQAIISLVTIGEDQPHRAAAAQQS